MTLRHFFNPKTNNYLFNICLIFVYLPRYSTIVCQILSRFYIRLAAPILMLWLRANHWKTIFASLPEICQRFDICQPHFWISNQDPNSPIIGFNIRRDLSSPRVIHDIIPAIFFIDRLPRPGPEFGHPALRGGDRGRPVFPGQEGRTLRRTIDKELKVKDSHFSKISN